MATNGRPEWFGTAFSPVAKSTHCLRERKHALESIVQFAVWRTPGLTAGLGRVPCAGEGDARLIRADEPGKRIAPSVTAESLGTTLFSRGYGASGADRQLLRPARRCGFSCGMIR